MPKSLHERIVARARELITRPGSWVQGGFAFARDGRALSRPIGITRSRRSYGPVRLGHDGEPTRKPRLVRKCEFYLLRVLARNGRLPRCSDSSAIGGFADITLSAWRPQAICPRANQRAAVASDFMGSRPK